MQLQTMRITGLFGHFDYEIPFNKDEKITIITGPNGYGKTTLLKIIDSVFNQNFDFLVDLQFKQISLLLEDKEGGQQTLLIEKLEELKGFDDDMGLMIKVSAQDAQSHCSGVFHYFKGHRVLPRSAQSDGMASLRLLPDIINSITVQMVQDQRLIIRSQSELNINSIEKYAADLSAMIVQCNAQYAEVSKRLDSSLPTRLFAKQNKIKSFDQPTLRIKLDELTLKKQRLIKHHLLANDAPFSLDNEDISPEDIKILSLYVQDNTEKLSVYDDLLERIEVFTGILNNKGLAFKTVSVVPQDGFVFTNDANYQLDLTDLSSGEQHQVILAYELIFEAKDNSLILIDEPEISLHIAWQKEFLSDLKKIIALKNLSVVIATHSPQIIDNDWDLTVDLEEG